MSMSRTSSVDDACNDPGPIYTQIAARNSSTSILGSSRPITHCSGTWNWTLHMATWRVPTSDSSSVALKDKEHVAHVSKHSENPSCNLPPPDRRTGAPFSPSEKPGEL